MRILTLVALSALATASQAGTILGLDNNGIYAIDTNTGNATLSASLSGHGTGDANGLAYDAATNAAYFQRNGDLWKVDLTAGLFTNTGYGVGDIASATFLNGAYVYGTSSQLLKVDVASGAASTLGTYGKGWSFGDIVSAVDGTIYGSSGSSVFKVGANGTYTSIGNSGKSLQLGFVGGTLYGIANGNAGAPSGSLYTIDTATGALSGTGVTAKYNGNALAIRDAATYQPVPEPATMAALAMGAVGLLRRRKRA